MRSLAELIVLIRGGGEIASGVAHRLHQCHFAVCMTEITQPRAIRREVAFSEAVYRGEKEVEGVTARLVKDPGEIFQVWREGKICVLVDPEARIKDTLKPEVLVDAIIAKRNVSTKISDAELVIGLGAGFRCGEDVHIVVETNRGHNLGRVILQGEAEPDTEMPGEIAGYTAERLLRAPIAGTFATTHGIGDHVHTGQVLAHVNDVPITGGVGGVIRGLLRDGTVVDEGMKVGDVDPRGIKEYCYTISDKSRAIAGGVLEAVLSRFNR